MLSSSNLKKHKMLHSAGKEKNFVCDICGLATTTDWYLDKHKRQQHKRGKDIKCQYCEKLFRRVDVLERHIDSKHPETSAKNFTCTKCEKSFIFKSSLFVVKLYLFTYKISHTVLKIDNLALKLEPLAFRIGSFGLVL